MSSEEVDQRRNISSQSLPEDVRLGTIK